MYYTMLVNISSAVVDNNYICIVTLILGLLKYSNMEIS